MEGGRVQAAVGRHVNWSFSDFVCGDWIDFSSIYM
jgi:hypothetical protein